MKFRVRGEHVKTKLAAEVVVEAETGKKAFSVARTLGIDGESAEPVEDEEDDGNEPVDPMPPERGESRILPVLLVAGVVGTFFYSPSGLIASACVLLLLSLTFVERTSGWARWVVGISGRGKFVSALVGLAMLMYMGIAATFSIVRISDDRETAAGSARIAALVSDARAAIEERRVADAQALLRDALRVRPGDGKDAAEHMLRAIDLSEDAAGIEREMLMLADDEFDAYASTARVPTRLTTGLAVLDARVSAHVESCMERVTEGRRLRKEEAERVARVERELAERDERDAREKEEREKIERAATATKVRDRILVAFSGSAQALIADIQVRPRSGEGYTADVIVTDLWHMRHRQIRLQDAQRLLSALKAAMTSSGEGSGRLNIVDGGWNKVGGTDMWGEVWVND